MDRVISASGVPNPCSRALFNRAVRTALYELGTVQEEAEIDEVVESATSTFGATPPSFESRLRKFLEERSEDH